MCMGQLIYCSPTPTPEKRDYLSAAAQIRSARDKDYLLNLEKI